MRQAARSHVIACLQALSSCLCYWLTLTPHLMTRDVTDWSTRLVRAEQLKFCSISARPRHFRRLVRSSKTELMPGVCSSGQDRIESVSGDVLQDSIESSPSVFGA
ncbi:hypothetical protein IWX48DRAFT_272826 [Phyllosticta citricarpa]